MIYSLEKNKTNTKINLDQEYFSGLKTMNKEISSTAYGVF